jgi:glycosyltransferase involved in cell wall biosynthesis
MMQTAQTVRFAPGTIKPRHICIVTETYPPEVNGLALTLARLVEGLRRLGHAVSIVRPRQRKEDPRRGKTERLVPSLPLPGYSGLRLGLPASKALWQNWSVNRPDIIYVATEGPLGWSALKIAQRLEIPIFSGFHTSFDRYSRYYHLGWLQPLVTRYLYSFHNRTLGTLVASPDLRDRLRGMGMKNVSIMDRGVDSRLFDPARRCATVRRAWRAADRDLVALYVGRVAAEKNLALAIEAYRAMRRVDDGAKFVIVGDGPLRATLQEKHPDIIFCGVHRGDELARRYASADVFLFPSETETFGNVTLEAMASGLVVVAFDYAAARMHITDGQSGVLVPYGDSRAFVNAAVNLAHRPQSLIQMRHEARAHASFLDWQHVVNRFATLLIGVLERQPRDEVASERLQLATDVRYT